MRFIQAGRIAFLTLNEWSDLKPGKCHLLVLSCENQKPHPKKPHKNPSKKPESKQNKLHGPKPHQILLFDLSLLFKWT